MEAILGPRVVRNIRGHLASEAIVEREAAWPFMQQSHTSSTSNICLTLFESVTLTCARGAVMSHGSSMNCRHASAAP